MLWQVSLIVNKFKTVIVTVPENCTGAELFQAIKRHSEVPKGEDIVLTTVEGDEIANTPGKRVRDYGVLNKGHVHLAVKVPGGVWPSVDDLDKTSRHLKTTDQLLQITTSNNYPDVFGLDDDAPRAIMSCGHAVAPLSLATHCLYELEKGADKITCPDRRCNAVWKFMQIREAACLSEDESSEFEIRILLNRINKNGEKIKDCPKCGVSLILADDNNKRITCSNCSVRSGRRYDFCWTCLKEWKSQGMEKCGNEDCGQYKTTFEILANCPLKVLNQLKGVVCPSKRGCPKCLTIIEYTQGCKHMKCPECKYDFCFICLKSNSCNWRTDPYYNDYRCPVAPRQTSTNWRTLADDTFLADPRQTPPINPLSTDTPIPVMLLGLCLLIAVLSFIFSTTGLRV